MYESFTYLYIFSILLYLFPPILRVRTQAREDYELLMKQNRNSTISGQDIYITHRCQVYNPTVPHTTGNHCCFRQLFCAVCVLFT